MASKKIGNILLLGLAVFSLSGCFSNQQAGTVGALIDKGVLSNDFTVLMNFSSAGWDFYSDIGLIKAVQNSNTTCSKMYRARIEIRVSDIEHDFQASSAPNKHSVLRETYPIDSTREHEVCEVIIDEFDTNWFGILVIDHSFIYFENRNTPHDPSPGFRYVKTLKE